MEQNRIEEAVAIEEMEIAIKQLKSAYVAVLNKFARVSKNPDLKINPSDDELTELDNARQRFDSAKENMDRIAGEIRRGERR